MIFNFLASTIILSFILFPLPTLTIGKTNAWNTENIVQEEEIEVDPIGFKIGNEQYEKYKKTTLPTIRYLSLDLNGNNINEEIVIKSHPGFPGDQNTEIYINSNSQPTLTEVGVFYALNVHKIDNEDNHITELQLQTGQSLNTLFYSYQDGKLKKIPVSTDNPSSWHGIVSRNIPEFRDIDNDGSVELLVYYNFLNDPIRAVEVYKYVGDSFNLIQKYEEEVSRRTFN